MTNTKDWTHLYTLLVKLEDYEPSIYDKIKSLVLYPIKDTNELQIAVKLWLKNEYKAKNKYGHISNWDTSNVEDMCYMFSGCENFNQDINSLEPSQVVERISFNQDIGSWDTPQVVDMFGMFIDSEQFNQDIGSWNTSNVTNMGKCFLELKNLIKI